MLGLRTNDTSNAKWLHENALKGLRRVAKRLFEGAGLRKRSPLGPKRNRLDCGKRTPWLPKASPQKRLPVGPQSGDAWRLFEGGFYAASRSATPGEWAFSKVTLGRLHNVLGCGERATRALKVHETVVLGWMCDTIGSETVMSNLHSTPWKRLSLGRKNNHLGCSERTPRVLKHLTKTVALVAKTWGPELRNMVRATLIILERRTNVCLPTK